MLMLPRLVTSDKICHNNQAFKRALLFLLFLLFPTFFCVPTFPYFFLKMPYYPYFLVQKFWNDQKL